MAFPYDQNPAENLIDGQLTPNDITNEALLDAVRAVPRELFVPDAFKATAYVDEEIPLGEGRVLIEPLLQAKLLQAMEVAPHESVLIIGGASGYSAALLARFAARIEMVEENPALAHAATDTFKKLGLTLGQRRGSASGVREVPPPHGRAPRRATIPRSSADQTRSVDQRPSLRPQRRRSRRYTRHSCDALW